MTNSPQSSESSRSPEPTRRRRFLTGAVLAVLIASAIGGIGARAFAHGWGGGWHHGGFMRGDLDPAAVDQHLDRMLKHLYVEIDATDAQKQQLAPIVKAAANDLLPVRGQMRDTRKQALELLSQPSIDRGALEALRAEKLRLADQASRRLTAAIADVADVLTPEQRRSLAERAQRRHGGHR
jgi:periplasmic protein CpxP/Spy